jgi:trk system potassium uptake protein TrkA
MTEERACPPPGRLPRRTVIVGCGRLGSLLAGRLSAAGTDVVVVDWKEGAFDRLDTDFSGLRVTGDAAEPAVLREAGIEKSECVLATTQDDNLNLLVAEVARTVFGIRRVIVRVFDPKREAVFEDSGLEAVSPTLLAADAILTSLRVPPVPA